MTYQELYQKTQKKLDELKEDFIQDRIKYDDFRKQSYENLSRFVSLCEDNKWQNQRGFREYQELCWNFGHN